MIQLLSLGLLHKLYIKLYALINEGWWKIHNAPLQIINSQIKFTHTVCTVEYLIVSMVPCNCHKKTISVTKLYLITQTACILRIQVLHYKFYGEWVKEYFNLYVVHNMYFPLFFLSVIHSFIICKTVDCILLQFYVVIPTLIYDTMAPQ